jgi:putative membrane protein insertion efficiency factor
MNIAIRLLFRVYRMALSPLLGPACRYEPSCSHYAELAIERFGLLRGGGQALRRLARCHPFCAGGRDPVPNASDKVSGTYGQGIA